VLGQPALHESVLEDLDHLLAVSIGRPDVAAVLCGRHLVARTRCHLHPLLVQRVEALAGSAPHHHDLIPPGGRRPASWPAAPDTTPARADRNMQLLLRLLYAL